MPKYSFMIARFPYHGDEKYTVADWLAATYHGMKTDPSVGNIVRLPPIDDTPITMSRNRACKQFQKSGCDFLLMIDSDMAPDLPYPGAKTFWKSAFEFAIAQPRPVIVAAPYCGPPPHENVYIFRWANRANDVPDVEFQLAQYSREEAAQRAGFEEVAALPTGMILIPRGVFDILPPPWFEYEWTDKYRTDKATTEDVYFTRNASLNGVKVYCAWDSWAGHWKQKVVTRPRPMGPEQVGEELKKAMLRNSKDDRLIDLTEDGLQTDDAAVVLASPPAGRPGGIPHVPFGNLFGHMCAASTGLASGLPLGG